MQGSPWVLAWITKRTNLARSGGKTIVFGRSASTTSGPEGLMGAAGTPAPAASRNIAQTPTIEPWQDLMGCVLPTGSNYSGTALRLSHPTRSGVADRRSVQSF